MPGPIADTNLLAQYALMQLTGVTTPFDSISGLSIDIGVISTAMKTEVGMPVKVFRSAPPTYGDLTCSAGLSKTDKSLFTWWDEVALGKVMPKDGTLQILDVTGTPTASFTIVGALLTSLTVSPMGLDNPDRASVTATFNCVSYKRMS
jgi:hypothetical protein